MPSNYVVTLDLRTIGSLDLGLGKNGRGGIGEVAKPLSMMKQGFGELRDVGAKFMGVLDGAASAAMSVAKWGIIAAGATAFGLAYEGVVKLNAGLETTQISLATIFKANNQTNDLSGGFELANEQIAKMRQDAKRLPGEFADLQRIFVTTAIPGFAAGANVDHLRELSAKVMSFAAISSIPQDVAAREMAILLEGRAGAHNLLGMRLSGLTGAKAKEFNGKAPEDRLKFLEAELDKYGGAVDRFSRSYEGLSSTLVDNLKQFGIAASGPLFLKVKETLTDINRWFDNNQALVGSWADYVGGNAGAAFDYVKAKIVEWWPAIQSFFTNARDEFNRIKAEWGPTFESIGETIKSALANPETLKNVEKIGQVGFGIASGVAGVASGISSIGGAAGAAGGGAGIMGMLGGAIPAGSVLAAVLAPTALAGGLAYGAFGGVKTQGEIADDDLARGTEMAAKTMKRFHEETDNVGQLTTKVYAETNFLRANFQDTAASALDLAFAMENASHAALMFDALMSARDARGQAAGFGDKYEGADYGGANREYSFMPMLSTMDNISKNTAAATKKTPGGHGGTTVQKVEIVVTTNAHPSRVARSVVDEISKLNRNPRISQFAPPGFR